jgi:hypothetical protein
MVGYHTPGFCSNDETGSAKYIGSKIRLRILTQGFCDGAMGVSFKMRKRRETWKDSVRGGQRFLRFSILKETPMTPQMSAMPHA